MHYIHNTLPIVALLMTATCVSDGNSNDDSCGTVAVESGSASAAYVYSYIVNKSFNIHYYHLWNHISTQTLADCLLAK